VSGDLDRNRNTFQQHPLANAPESPGILFKRLFERLSKRLCDRRELLGGGRLAQPAGRGV